MNLPPNSPRRNVFDRRRSAAPALSFIEANLHREVTLVECAELCALSPSHFSRRFHEDHCMTFKTYLLKARIERACTLLEARPRSISEVAYAVGFNDLSYFTRVFRRLVGMTPSAYFAIDVPIDG